MNTSWKQLLTEAESLTKANGKNAWRTAQIARELFNSEEFREAACKGKLDEVESKLAKYSGRFALGLNDMIQMIEHFPDQADWASGRLDILRDKTCKLLLQKRGEPKGTRRRATVAESEALKKKVKALQARVRQLEAENEELRRQLHKPKGKAA